MSECFPAEYFCYLADNVCNDDLFISTANDTISMELHAEAYLMGGDILLYFWSWGTRAL